MKRMLLPIGVVVVSAGYVWTQQGQVDASLTTGASPLSIGPTAAAEPQASSSFGDGPITLGGLPTASDPADATPTPAATAGTPTNAPSTDVASIAPTGPPIAPSAPPAQAAPAARPSVEAEVQPAMPSTAPPAPATAPPQDPAVADVPIPRPRPQPPASAVLAQSTGLRDGTYDGPVANAYYGLVHVAAVIQGGRLTNVKVLEYPTDRRTSRYLNSFAIPALQQEALQTQDARVHFVSGATLSSHAFAESLAGALQKARG